jgi:hypothetical protein
VYLERGHVRHEQRFVREVSAARAGYVFAHNHRAYQRWLVASRQPSTAVTGPGGRGLTGEELEHVLAAMARTNPDIVAVRVVH